MIWFLSFVILILLILLAFSLWFTYKFASTVMRIEDEVGESLEILDKCYGRIGKILEIPVGSDDPFVQSVIEEIKRAHDAILIIANKVTEGWKHNPKDDEEDD